MKEAFEILRDLFDVCNLGDFVYSIRETEGLGWDGPEVVKWGDACDRARKLLEENKMEEKIEVVPDFGKIVLDEIRQERERQIAMQFDGKSSLDFDQDNSQNDWIAYICAYAGRAADKVARNERDGCNFRENMIKVATLAAAAVEALDRGWC